VCVWVRGLGASIPQLVCTLDDCLDKAIHSSLSRISIDHDPEKPTLFARRKINHEPPLHQRARNALRDIAIVLCVVAQHAAFCVVEAHLQTGQWVWADGDEIAVLLERREEVRCGGVSGRDKVCKVGGAVVVQGKEELQAIRAAAALGRQVGQVVDVVYICVWVVVEEVAGGQGEGFVERGHVAAEEEGRCHGHAEHLVRVDGDAVGEVCPRETRRCVAGAEDDAGAPGAVNVEPEIVALCNGGQGGKGVKGAVDRRSGGGVEEEGGFAAGFAGDDG